MPSTTGSTRRRPKRVPCLLWNGKSRLELWLAAPDARIIKEVSPTFTVKQKGFDKLGRVRWLNAKARIVKTRVVGGSQIAVAEAGPISIRTLNDTFIAEKGTLQPYKLAPCAPKYLRHLKRYYFRIF